MADENFEQQKEFMLQQQAESAARIQQIKEIILDLTRGTRDHLQGTDKRLDNVDVKIAALVDAQIRTEESMKETQESVKKTGEALRSLADSQTRTEESMRETQESLRATQESIKKTDEALRRLTALVDRYISERRNGGSGASTNPEQ